MKTTKIEVPISLEKSVKCEKDVYQAVVQTFVIQPIYPGLRYWGVLFGLVRI